METLALLENYMLAIKAYFPLYILRIPGAGVQFTSLPFYISKPKIIGQSVSVTQGMMAFSKVCSSEVLGSIYIFNWSWFLYSWTVFIGGPKPRKPPKAFPEDGDTIGMG